MTERAHREDGGDRDGWTVPDPFPTARVSETSTARGGSIVHRSMGALRVTQRLALPAALPASRRCKQLDGMQRWLSGC